MKTISIIRLAVLFGLVSSLTSGCAVTAYIPPPAFHTPETSGALWSGRAGGGLGAPAAVTVVNDPEATPPNTSTPDVTSGASMGFGFFDLGIFSWLDLSLVKPGVNLQLIGTRNSPGFKLGVFAGQGRMTTQQTNGTAESKTDTLANQAVIELGWRVSGDALVYLNLGRSDYRIGTRVAQGATVYDFEDKGTETDAIVGLSAGGMGFHMIVEVGPRTTTLERGSLSSTKTMANLGLGYAW